MIYLCMGTKMTNGTEQSPYKEETRLEKRQLGDNKSESLYDQCSKNSEGHG